MEYLDLYNDKKEKIGKTILRGTEIPLGYYIMLSIIFIENSAGEFLFQYTSKEKGNVWATTGGHVKSGDDALITIVKEVEEELGIRLNKNELKHVFTGMKNGRILEAFYIKKDIDINSLTLQKEEVESVKWLSKNELRELINQDNVRKSNIEILKELGLI